LSFLLKQEFRIGLNATWVCALQEWVQPELAGNPMVAQSRIPATYAAGTFKKSRGLAEKHESRATDYCTIHSLYSF
jgi:hypothetical protein